MKKLSRPRSPNLSSHRVGILKKLDTVVVEVIDMALRSLVEVHNLHSRRLLTPLYVSPFAWRMAPDILGGIGSNGTLVRSS